MTYLPLSTILILDVGIVPTVWYFSFFILLSESKIKPYINRSTTRNDDNRKQSKIVVILDKHQRAGLPSA
jgi:hypothetical protein